MTYEAPPTRDQLEARLRQQAMLADFGRRALTTDDLDVLLRETAVLAAQGLNTDMSKVLELLPDGDALLLRAGVGWKPGWVGTATVGTDTRSAAGYTLKMGAPVISEHVLSDPRFDPEEIAREHGVISSANVIIRGRSEPFGTLQVDSTTHRCFTGHDIDFLQGFANLLGAAIDRLEATRLLASAAEERAVLLRELQHRVKNNLQTITSLLNMQLRRANNPEVRHHLEILLSRIETLRMVHTQLYLADYTGRLDLSGYLGNWPPTWSGFSRPSPTPSTSICGSRRKWSLAPIWPCRLGCWSMNSSPTAWNMPSLKGAVRSRSAWMR